MVPAEHGLSCRHDMFHAAAFRTSARSSSSDSSISVQWSLRPLKALGSIRPGRLGDRAPRPLGHRGIGVDAVQWRTGRPCLTVIAEQIPAALHVLDRLRIMRNMNMAIDDWQISTNAVRQAVVGSGFSAVAVPASML
jgi:hypothetical protein